MQRWEGGSTEEGRRQYRGGKGAVQRWCGKLTSMSAMDLISSSQLIRASLLLPEALEMLIRTHITCAVRVLYSRQYYTIHNTDPTTAFRTLSLNLC